MSSFSLYQRYFIRFLFIISSLILFLTYLTDEASSEDLSLQMVGGEFVRLDQGPVALIKIYPVGGDVTCTGILVGVREVLTAAHCILGDWDSNEYAVVVGGEIYQVTDRYYHHLYNDYLHASVVAPVDLGMLILSKDVTGTEPIPILFNDIVEPGEDLQIFGYGRNELSGIPERNPFDDAKLGRMVVEESINGLLSSHHSSGGASTCGGDSGGPAMQILGDYIAVVGVLSVGTNIVLDSGTCILANGGSFSYVDLQSESSQEFLASFPGVRYVSGFRIYVITISQSIVMRLTKVSRAKSSEELRKRISPVLKTINNTLRFSDGVRLKNLKSARNNLIAAQNSDKVEDGLKLVRKALSSVKKVLKLGVL